MGASRRLPEAHTPPPRPHFHADGLDASRGLPGAYGTVRGEALFPIHKAAPEAAARDEQLYKALALVDAIRAGKAREQAIASNLLKEILDGGR